MNQRPGPVGASALSSTPSTMHLRPIFWMLPSAFSSMVVRPPAMLPLVGCESRQVAGLVAVDHLLVAVEHEHELLAHLVVAAARGDQVLAAGELGGLAEAQRHAVRRSSLSKALPTVGIGAAAGGGVGFAALGGDPQLVERALLALQLAGPLHEFLAALRGAHDGVVVAVPSMPKPPPACRWRRCRRPPSSSSRPRCRSRPPRRHWGCSRCRSACGNAGPGRRRTAAGRRGAGSPACP